MKRHHLNSGNHNKIPPLRDICFQTPLRVNFGHKGWIFRESRAKAFRFAKYVGKKARWPSGQAEVCKTLYAGSIPARASNSLDHFPIF